MFAQLALQYVSMSSSQNRLLEPVLLNLPWNLRQKKTEVDKQTAALVCSLDHWVCATVEKLAFVAWGEQLVKVAMKLYLHIFSKIWF